MTTGRAIAVFARHPSNWVIVGLIAATAGYATSSGGGAAFRYGLLPLVGMFLFGMNEYTLHRFLLHAPVPDPSRHPWLFRRFDRLHYGHHEEPTNIPLLFAPIWFTLPIAVGNWFLLVGILSLAPWLTTTPATTAAALLTGSFTTLLYYEWVHMIAHLPYAPPVGFQRYMKKYHLWHHYRSEKLWFGVTSPLFDRLYGTYAEPGDVPMSPTARNLGGIDPERVTADSAGG